MNPLKFMLKHFVLKKKSNFLLIIFLLINSISFSQVTAIDLQLAQKYFIDRDYEKANLYYEKIAQESEYLPKIFKSYKATLIELELFKEAEKLCKNQIKLYPQQLSLLVDLGLKTI